ncbi:MAG: molybdenum cofactor guanylyltransferase [Bacteroidota bacterium]
MIGLVLAGGKSKRMGVNKASICYHDQPQGVHVWEMLSNEGVETYLSLGQNSTWAEAWDLPFILDLFLDYGPLGALFSAQAKFPDQSVLMIACDMPLIGPKDIQTLIRNRKMESDVSLYTNVVRQQPEPLLSIWEASSQQSIAWAIGQKQLSVMKILDQLQLHSIAHPDPERFLNINTPDERQNFQPSGGG